MKEEWSIRIDNDLNIYENNILNIISEIMNAEIKDITSVEILKAGMTNKSYIFEYRRKKYILRTPGEGTNSLIDRYNEYTVYQAIKNLNICDEIFYINPDNGYKITEYISGARVCNSMNWCEVERCIMFLRNMHDKKIMVNHTFDLFDNIEYYESLWDGNCSIYKDYMETKNKIYQLKTIIESYDCEYCLTHIDAIPDNFLIDRNGEIRLIDWEYAGMQDPHIDIAMFAIYAHYNKEQINKLINIYFDNNCKYEVKIKIYCYVAVCGLLWSNWCEFKRMQGVEFGEYSSWQYDYAKQYYDIVMSEKII